MQIHRSTFLALGALVVAGACTAAPPQQTTPSPAAPMSLAARPSSPAPFPSATDVQTSTPSGTASPGQPTASRPPSPTAPPASGSRPSETPTPEATPTNGPTPVASLDELNIEWTRSTSDPGIGELGDYDFLLPGAIVFEDRFVILGRAFDRQTMDEHLEIWVSSDGLTWHDSSVEGITPEAHNAGVELELRDVTVGGPGLVAVGQERECCGAGTNAAVWVSDDASVWSRAYDSDQDGSSGWSWVWSQDGRLYAGGPDTKLFTSIDGADWMPVDIGPAPDGYVEPTIKRNDGVTGFVSNGGDGGSPVDVWSLTSAGWQRMGQLPNSTGAGIGSATVGPRGWVAVGTRYEKGGKVSGIAWRSQDGLRWELAAAPPGAFIANDILGDGSGFVAAGYDYPAGCAFSWEGVHGATWTSVDGSAWRKMSDKGWDHRAIFVLLRAGRELIGVGADFNDYSLGAVWTAQLPPTRDVDDNPPAPIPGERFGCG